MSNDKQSTVRQLREHIASTMLTVRPPEGADTVELRFPQKLRAAAAGAVFEACRPHFTHEDEDDLGYILAQLAGWVVHGKAYDPDLDEDMLEGLEGA